MSYSRARCLVYFHEGIYVDEGEMSMYKREKSSLLSKQYPRENSRERAEREREKRENVSAKYSDKGRRRDGDREKCEIQIYTG